MEELREVFGEWWGSRRKALDPPHRNHLLVVVMPLFSVVMVLVSKGQVEKALMVDGSVALSISLAVLVGLLAGAAVASLYAVFLYGLVHRLVFDRKFRQDGTHGGPRKG